jgi:hypothetical protein
MGKQEVFALIYKISTIGNREAVKNIKTVLTYWQKNGIIDLNY